MKIPQNLQNIISHIGWADLLGEDPTQIDSRKEYNLLGQYLNGSYSIENCPKENLSKKEIKVLTKLLNSLKVQWGEWSNEKVEEDVVTRDNLEEYCDKLSSMYYQEELYKDQIIRLENKLIEFVKKYDYPETFAGNVDIGKDIKYEVVPLIDSMEEGRKISEIFNVSNKSELQSAVDRFKENNSLDFSNPDNVDIGDGDFDEVVVQKADVCPFLAGINSLANGNGKVLLENNMFRDPETGIYAIHLQEAENCGLPSNGVYIITPQEIINARDSIAEGEGDSIAYVLAIDKYFNELRTEKPELAEEFDNTGLHTGDIREGNFNTRFYNIITGLRTTEIGYTSYNEDVPLGINMSSIIAYENVSQLVSEGRGTATLSILNQDGAHAISVVGVTNDGLLIQESNNDPELFLSQYGYFSGGAHAFEQTEAINGSPTYILSRDFYEEVVFSTCLVRWE